MSKELLPAVVRPMELVVSAKDALYELDKFREVVKEVLKENTDYGPPYPGSDKKCLLKPGAEKILEVYNFYADPVITQRVENWETGLFDYEFRTTIYRRSDNAIFAVAYGSCNSFESKFRYRNGERKCPDCGKATIIKGREEYGGGWLCFAKKGGCGAKFGDLDKSITEQLVGRVENPDLADVKNTVLKMAEKRSFVGAAIRATRSSELFTLDLDDYDYTIIDAATVEAKEEGKKQSADSSISVTTAKQPPETKTASVTTKPIKDTKDTKAVTTPTTTTPTAPPVTQESNTSRADTKLTDNTSTALAKPGDEQKEQLKTVAFASGFDGPDIGAIMKIKFGITAANMAEAYTWKVWEAAIKWFGEHKKPDSLKNIKVTAEHFENGEIK